MREGRSTPDKSGPRVSVIMAVRNCEETLAESLDSLLSQTHQNWDLVVCDDASWDGTRTVLQEYQARLGNDRMTVLRNETNMKLAFSLNRCLEFASGDYIARMDGDDISRPSRLATQLRYLEENPGVDLVGTSMQRFNGHSLGAVIYPRYRRPSRSTMSTSPTAFFHATLLARRHVFERVGGYTVSWRTERGQDLDLWYKFFAAELVGENLAEPLYLMRDTQDSVRRRTRKSRLGIFATRVKGSRELRLPLISYIHALAGLQKILLPMRLLDLRHHWIWRKSSQHQGSASPASPETKQKV